MADHSHHMHHHGDQGTKMDSSGDNASMSMQMTFYASVDATILFNGWKTDTVGELIGSCIGIFLMAVIYEGVKYFREYLFKKFNSQTSYNTVCTNGESNHMMLNKDHTTVRYRLISSHHLIQTALHVFQVTLSYFLMLIFMTYNVWLCLSVVLGAGVGFFLFGWNKAVVVDITEHCH